MSNDGEGFEYPNQETDNVQQQTTMSEHVSARHARAHTLARPFFTRPPCSRVWRLCVWGIGVTYAYVFITLDLPFAVNAVGDPRQTRLVFAALVLTM